MGQYLLLLLQVEFEVDLELLCVSALASVFALLH
jgi:hypothetical protein